MSNAATNRPISSHPAFRWAVGLWFAALLGAGLFVMPDSIHAAIRQGLQIDTLLPGGTIGKAALAGAAALLGLLLGMVLAGRVAALNAARDFDADDDEYEEVSWQDQPSEAVEDIADEPRRPFSPREYFGDEGGFEGAEAVDTTILEPEPEVAEFEEVAEACEPATAPSPAESDAPHFEPPAERETEEASQALGDLPLAALTARLKNALDANRALAEAPPVQADGELDPVIAFLRREADRTATTTSENDGDDPQAALRSALDRLSQVSNPR